MVVIVHAVWLDRISNFPVLYAVMLKYFVNFVILSIILQRRDLAASCDEALRGDDE